MKLVRESAFLPPYFFTCIYTLCHHIAWSNVWLLDSDGELQRCNVHGHILDLTGTSENTHRLVASSSRQIQSTDRIKPHTAVFSPDDTQVLVASSCSGNQNPLSIWLFEKKERGWNNFDQSELQRHSGATRNVMSHVSCCYLGLYLLSFEVCHTRKHSRTNLTFFFYQAIDKKGHKGSDPLGGFHTSTIVSMGGWNRSVVADNRTVKVSAVARGKRPGSGGGFPSFYPSSLPANRTHWVSLVSGLCSPSSVTLREQEEEAGGSWRRVEAWGGATAADSSKWATTPTLAPHQFIVINAASVSFLFVRTSFPQAKTEIG